LGKAYTYLRMLPKFLALAAVAYGQCVIDVGGAKFDFNSLSSKQITAQVSEYSYEFTFCTASPQPCGTRNSSSLCQSNPPFQYSLGLWEQFKDWRVSSGKLVGTLIGENCGGKDRMTNVTFQCVDASPAIVSMVELDICDYEMVIQVPLSICSTVTSCCAPPTYTSRRMEIGGGKAVVQRDSSIGDWFDGNYQGRGQSILCSTYYNRCFTFPPTFASCVGSAYRAAPVQCFGTPDWSAVAQEPLTEANPILQTVWLSALDGNYVVTMPLGSSSGCVPVSGSAIDTSVGFSLSPDSALWEVPQICLKQLNISKF